MEMRTAIILFIVLVCSSLSEAAVSIVDQNSSTGLEINTINAVETVDGQIAEVTFGNSSSLQATTAASVVKIESDQHPFRLLKWCVNSSNTTAASAATVTVRRVTTVSSGGVSHTMENPTAGANTASFNYDKDGAYTGVVRSGNITPGTAGATLDQQGFQVGEVGAAEGSLVRYCKDYDDDSGKAPLVVPGPAVSGITVTVGAVGAGGRSISSVTVYTRIDKIATGSGSGVNQKEVDPTLIDDGSVIIGSGSINPTTLTFNSDGGIDGTIAWDGTNDEFEIIGSQVGIGTTAPADLLHLVGSSTSLLIEDSGASFKSHFASGTISGVYFANANPFTAVLDDTTKDSWGFSVNPSATGGSFLIRHMIEGGASFTTDFAVLSAEGSTFGRTGIGTTTINTDSRLEVAGHISTEGTAPTVSACGSAPSPSIVGNDVAGKVTTGGNVIFSCTLTFATAWANAPACTVSDETAITLVRATATTTTLTLDSGSALTAHVLAYICIGRG